MFELKRKGSQLEFIIEYHIPYGSTWITTFDRNCANEHTAQLLYAHIRDVMESKIKTIRREAYEQGWKDKSSKKPKQEWFSTEI